MTVPPKRQRLADELVKVRRRAGMSGRDMARVLHGPSGKPLSQAQLYRYDKAVTTPSIPTVRAWLDACQNADAHAVSVQDRERILALAEAAHSEPRSWKDMADAGVTSTQSTAAEQDEESVAQWCAENVILPGLLTTPEYTAAAVRRADLHSQFDHAEQARDRLARQALLFEPGRAWQFVIAERLLSWSPGSVGIMPAQRSRLVALADTPGVEIAVLRDDAVLEPSGLWSAPFTIIQPRVGARYVVVEGVHGEDRYDKPDEVESFALLWDRLWSASRRGDDAVALIRSVG